MTRLRPSRHSRRRGDPLVQTCDSVRESISARFDGERSELGERAARSHLDACASCRRYRDDLAALARHTRLRTSVSAPAELAPSLVALLTDRAPAADAPPASRTSDRGRRVHRHRGTGRCLARWTVAMVPASAFVAAFALGAFGGHPPLTPHLAPNPCIEHLLARHVWSGY